MNSGELKKAKRGIRAEVLRARDALSSERRAAIGSRVIDRFLQLPEVRAASSVLGFWSFGSEVPTAPLLERLHELRVRLALPRVAQDRLVAVTYAPGDPTRRSWFGAEEPADGTELDPGSFDVIVVPGVAFDRDGRRVGYGGGYYDRLLRHLPVFTVALAFELQIVDGTLPAGPFDVGVRAIVTEERTLRCPA